MKRAKVTLVPLVVAAAAFFIVLPRTGGDAVIRMIASGDGYAFDPSQPTVKAGARIRVQNDSQVTHTFEAVTGVFDLGDLQPGESRLITVDATGSVEFLCRYHGADGMSGTLTAT